MIFILLFQKLRLQDVHMQKTINILAKYISSKTQTGSVHVLSGYFAGAFGTRNIFACVLVVVVPKHGSL